jgi:hypothetical protein
VIVGGGGGGGGEKSVVVANGWQKREPTSKREIEGGSKVCREEKRERVFFLVERERERSTCLS